MNPNTDPCVVSSREKLKYLDQFNALNPVNGQVIVDYIFLLMEVHKNPFISVISGLLGITVADKCC